MIPLVSHHAMMVAGGWTLFGLGLIGAPLPLHPGLPFLALGGMMLAGRSRSFRRMAASLRALIPQTSEKLTAKSRDWPRCLRYLILRTDPRRVLGRAAAASQPRARGWAFR